MILYLRRGNIVSTNRFIIIDIVECDKIQSIPANMPILQFIFIAQSINSLWLNFNSSFLRKTSNK